MKGVLADERYNASGIYDRLNNDSGRNNGKNI
jgi:hypothetical protein